MFQESDQVDLQDNSSDDVDFANEIDDTDRLYWGKNVKKRIARFWKLCVM